MCPSQQFSEGHNLPPPAFIQTCAWEPQKIEPFIFVIFPGFWFLLHFNPLKFKQNIVLKRFV